MGGIRDLFKKIRDSKGIFHVKMDTIKDRNGKDLTEVKEIKRGGNITKKNCTKKKNIGGPDNHNGVVTHLEPDILEVEVKRALESISTKLMEFQLNYFKS